MIASSKHMSAANPRLEGPVDRIQQVQRSLDHACQAARAVEEFRGQETLVLDLTAITPIVDYFVVTTSTSGRQMRAMADEVNRVLREQGSARRGREGEAGSNWILQDYGDVVVHIFSPDARKLYDLEHLWADAPHIDWRAHCGLPAVVPAVE